MIADLRPDLRLSTLVRDKAERGTLGVGDRNLSEGDVIAPEAVPGATTPDGVGITADRYGYGGVPDLPTTSQIVRATDQPTKPCAICVHFHYDHGQNFFDREGLHTVPKAEGGFLTPGRTPMADDVVAGGAYDSREYGFCTAARRGPRLTHRFSTCEKWRPPGKLWRFW